MTHFAREYGNALFDLAREENLLEEILDQLKLLEECFSAEPQYIRLMCTRSVSPEERIALADSAFGGRVHVYLLNFIKLLIRRGAMDYFQECAGVYRMRFNEAFNIAEAVVTSAAPVNPQQLEALQAKLEAMSGKRILLHTRVNPELIGGMQVELEGRRYDNSIRTRLDSLRRNLSQ